MGFTDGMERKQKIFEVLNILMIYKYNEPDIKLPVNEVLKMATFSAIKNAHGKAISDIFQHRHLACILCDSIQEGTDIPVCREKKDVRLYMQSNE